MRMDRLPATSAVRVGRLNVTCLVPSEHPSPLALRSQFANLAEHQLPWACASLLGPLCHENDPSVWFIRRLDVDVAVDASWETGRMAQAWSQPVARELLRSVNGGDDGANVLRFANRAAYVAQFLLDLAAGRAWGKWYYIEFESLSSLPTNLAVTEALIREPGLCPRCIGSLAASGKLEEVIQVLTERDAERIYQAAFEACEPEVGEHVGVWISRLLVLWNEAPLRPPSQDEMRFRDGLRLLGRAALKFPEFHREQGFKTALDCLLEIRRIAAAQHSPKDLDRFIHWLATGDIASGLSSARKSGVDPSMDLVGIFVATMNGDIHWAEQAIGVITGEDSKGKAAACLITREDSQEEPRHPERDVSLVVCRCVFVGTVAAESPAG